MQPPAPAVLPALPIVGSDATFPVRRILCIGRNYADHVAEMGGDARRDPPVHFVKSPDALLPAPGPVAMRYPPRTADLQHEVELVVALGEGGSAVPAARALELVYGYAVGLDMTRRDRQREAKAGGGPWALAKDFDHAAVAGPITPGQAPPTGRITLSVGGDLRQDGTLDQMIWGVAELLSQLSASMTLRPGDLVFTGTPAGVGPVVRGDTMSACIADLPTLEVRVA